MFPSLFKNIDNLVFKCESCFLAKSQGKSYISKPYQPQNHFIFSIMMFGDLKRSLQLLEKKWFVTFIDYLCWVYLMQEKTKNETKFKDFLHYDKFQEKISILRSDNGTVLKQNFGNFFTRKRNFTSIFMFRYSKTKWNSQAKNKHLLEVALAMSFYMNMQKYLWEDAACVHCIISH